IAKKLRRSAGGHDFDAQRGDPFRELHDPRCIKHDDEGPIDGHKSLRRGKTEYCKREHVPSESKNCRRGKHNPKSGGYSFTRAFNFTWPPATSTRYSTSLQPFCFFKSCVFLRTNSRKFSRESLSTFSPAFCFAATSAR